MAGLGVLMIVMSVAAWLLRRRGRCTNRAGSSAVAVAMGPTGFITLLAGWVTTEAGRQPWVVYGVMRTATPCRRVTAQQVGVSLLVFVIVYFARVRHRHLLHAQAAAARPGAARPTHAARPRPDDAEPHRAPPALAAVTSIDRRSDKKTWISP